MKFQGYFLPLLLLAAPALQGCDDDTPDVPAGEGVPARRTVLIYMSAQNSLDYYSYKAADLQEILEGRAYIPDEDRLLVFVDDGAPRLYRYTRQEAAPQTVRTWTGDVCSTDPATLRDVLEWTRTHYPAEEYGLVMWSHADGWIPATDTDYPTAICPYSFGIDTGENSAAGNDGTQMEVDAMADAIDAAGIHLKYIFFDACLMQNFEVAWSLRDVTDYVVGAPMSTPAAGSNYAHQLQQGFFSQDPADIAATYYADVTDPLQTIDYGSFGIVTSAVRTDRLEAVAAALRAALPYSSLTDRNSPDMSDVLNYQAYTRTYFYRPHNYDARQAVERVVPAGHREAVLQAIDNAVTYKAATESFYIGPGSIQNQQAVDLDDYAGISLFIPQQTYTDHASETVLGDLNEAFRQTSWYEAAGWNVTGW